MRKGCLAVVFVAFVMMLAKGVNAEIPTCDGSVPTKIKCPTNPNDITLVGRVEAGKCSDVAVQSVPCNPEQTEIYPRNAVCSGRVAYNIHLYDCSFPEGATDMSKLCGDKQDVDECYYTEDCIPAMNPVTSDLQAAANKCTSKMNTLTKGYRLLKGNVECKPARPIINPIN